MLFKNSNVKKYSTLKQKNTDYLLMHYKHSRTNVLFGNFGKSSVSKSKENCIK